MIRHMLTLGAVLALSACMDTTTEPVSTAPGDASDLAGMVGAKAGQAEMGLTNRGYSLVKTEGLTAYWYNPGNRTCAKIVTSDGRYSSITVAPLSTCGV